MVTKRYSYRKQTSIRNKAPPFVTNNPITLTDALLETFNGKRAGFNYPSPSARDHRRPSRIKTKLPPPPISSHHLTEINDRSLEKAPVFVSRDIIRLTLAQAPVTMAMCGARRRSLVLINAVMATQIPPLDNSFCNYADDTPGGHFEMNAVAQRCGLPLFQLDNRGRLEADDCRTRFPQPRKRVTNTINGRQVKLCYRNSLRYGSE